MHDVWPTISRELLLLPLCVLPRQKRIDADRWLRGREENRKLELADYVLMSWGKSGRTWLRVMMSRFYQQKYAIPEKYMLGFDNYHHCNPAIPRIFFTHGNYLRNYTGNWDDKAEFYGKKIIMLVRDPRDVAVSQFFQWKYRMKRRKKALNWYPPHNADISVFDFVMNADAGLPCIIRFFNIWAQELPKVAASIVIRYEDMRENPGAALHRIFEFLGTPGSAAEIQDAVDYAAYENMKKLEERNAFRSSGARLVPGRKGNPDSYKVRRAKVGGYRDYFDDEQLARIEALVATTLRPDFGYR
ncbi:MAG: sulfotransferase domain-containing protein [Gammaproteobacteria bacterium]|jgi:hypothetical protein